MTKTLKNDTLLERLQSVEQMLEMTTSHMIEVEKELKRKNSELEQKNSEIASSMEFSSMLLDAVQPGHEDLDKLFKDFFLINRPKELIGGDLFWSAQKDDTIYLSCMDCTGHGIPGALLSVAAHFSLNSTFHEKPYTQPNQLLMDFNDRFCNHLYSKKNGVNELSQGLDISLVMIDRKSGDLRFSGTRQSMIVSSDREVTLHKGERGYIGDERLILSDCQSIKIAKGDKFYLFTDGIVDQFGGPKNKRFRPSRLIKEIEKSHHLKMKEQQKHISQELDRWKNKSEQTDDILMIGFQID